MRANGPDGPRAARASFIAGDSAGGGLTLSVLLARRGYAFVESAAERENAWGAVVGDTLARYSRIGSVRRGVVEVTVCNSAVLQELTFQKKQLLKKLVVALPDQKITDVRFRIGVVK